MENFKKRLVEFARIRYDMGQTRFEDHCGISRGTISNIKGAGPSTANLMRIASKCPELNFNWLLTGEGNMLEPTVEVSSSSTSVPLNDVHGNVVFVGNWDGLTPVIEAALDKALKK